MTLISSLEGLETLPPDLRWEEFSSAIVEAPWAVEFLDLTKPENRQEVGRYPAGLAFGEESELRWLKRESGLHLVYISDSGKDLGAASDPKTLEPVEAQPAGLLLWGERQAHGKYYDSRIPRLLEYPEWAPKPKPGGRLAVRIRHYELEDAGSVTPMFRCTGIHAAEGSDE